MVHVKLVVAGVVAPSVAVTVGLKTPTSVDVPEIKPEDGLMLRPLGNPVALQVSRSPLGSLPCICRLGEELTTDVWLPGGTIVGEAGRTGSENALKASVQDSIS